MTSTPDAHFFAFGRTSDSFKICSDMLLFTQRMLADFRQLFCARRAKVLGFLQLFRATFAEDLRDLRASLGLLCIVAYDRLGEELQRCSVVYTTYVGRVHANFARAVRKKFRKICNFFMRFRCKVCVISTPDARLFGCQHTHDLVKSFEDAM